MGYTLYFTGNKTTQEQVEAFLDLAQPLVAIAEAMGATFEPDEGLVFINHPETETFSIGQEGFNFCKTLRANVTLPFVALLEVAKATGIVESYDSDDNNDYWFKMGQKLGKSMVGG